MKRPNKEGLPSAEAVEGAFPRARTCNRPSRGAIAAALKGLRCEGSSPPAGNSQPGKFRARRELPCRPGTGVPFGSGGITEDASA